MTALSEGLDYLKGFISFMEGNCQCGEPAVYEIVAHQVCGCQKADIYCRAHAQEQWYASGLFGRVCPTHKYPTQVTYHPRRVFGIQEPSVRRSGCILCGPINCPAYPPAVTP